MAVAQHIIDQARAVPIGGVAAGLGLHRSGQELVGPCPVCGDGGKGARSDRFAVHLRKNTWLCRQCLAGGDVIALVMHVHGVDFPSAVTLLTGTRSASARPQGQAPAHTPATPSDDGLARANDIWRQAVPIAGTAGAAYLARRGILLDDVPEHGGLRFHPACPYGPRRLFPCVLARLTDTRTGAERGIHRRAIASGIEPKTMTLGPMGGAVVRLWPDEDVMQGLVIGEGIETVLAAATRMEHRGTLLRPAWACCVAGNLETFPVLAGIEALTILADADESGRGQEAAERCAERWANAGREVTILTPRKFGDMNDVVRMA